MSECLTAWVLVESVPWCTDARALSLVGVRVCLVRSLSFATKNGFLGGSPTCGCSAPGATVLRPFAPSLLVNPRVTGTWLPAWRCSLLSFASVCRLFWPSSHRLCHETSSLWTTSPGSVSSVHHDRALAGAASQCVSARPGVVGLPALDPEYWALVLEEGGRAMLVQAILLKLVVTQ